MALYSTATNASAINWSWRFAAQLKPMPLTFRLRKHADYQRVYQTSRKQFSRQMSYFFAPPNPQSGTDAVPRVGLTVGKVIGKAVDRNRIKRRMREVVRRNISLLQAPVDVVLHPRRSVLQLDFATLDREVANVFRAIQKAASSWPAVAAPPSDPR
jgi:ribonuclease P protein component